MQKQQVTHTSLKDALAAISQRLCVYEERYGMNSATFISYYQKGELSGDADFIDWMSDYQHYLVLKQQAENGSFIGVLHDRDDMSDSSEWVRDLRQQ